MVTVAMIGMGEMGSGVAGRLASRGARVLSDLSGRSDATIARAKAAGVEAVSQAEMAQAADMVLSIVPPALAAEVAGQLRPLIEASDKRPVFIDFNAIAPQTLQALAAPYLDRQLRLGDGSIIGGPPREGYSPRLFLSGEVAAETAMLQDLGLDAVQLSGALGDASALKMAYGGITKGMQAIGAAMALGAARNGVSEALVAELKSSQPAIYAWLTKALPSMYAKAYRWDGEMQEIAKFLQPEQGASDMLSGAADLYRRISEAHRQGPASEIISTLQRFAGRTG
jgi:3-hydroxyisobutyrate dehydrogenase-like beta-hydroxyacid dehydrogenase